MERTFPETRGCKTICLLWVTTTSSGNSIWLGRWDSTGITKTQNLL